ncbi:MAG: hypothetical protein KIT27_12035 [Legionellales bacterium]|nr:hypothetical protein [Legionellales bacterium]
MNVASIFNLNEQGEVIINFDQLDEVGYMVASVASVASEKLPSEINNEKIHAI